MLIKTVNTENLSKQNKTIILNIQEKVNESFLPIVLSNILLLEFVLLELLLKMKTLPLVILSFAIILLAIILHISKLKEAQKHISIVLTGHRYNMNIHEMYKLDLRELEKLTFTKLSWKSFKGYYFGTLFMIISATLVLIDSCIRNII